MSPSSTVLIVLGVVAVAGAVLSLRSMESTQGLRLRLAEKGEALLARENVPDFMRAEVTFMLDRVFPAPIWVYPLLMIVAPFMVPLLWQDIRQRHHSYSSTRTDLRAAFLEVKALHQQISLANNPVMMPLAQAHMSIIAALYSALNNVVRRTAVAPLDRDEVLVALETRRPPFVPISPKAA